MGSWQSGLQKESRMKQFEFEKYQTDHVSINILING